MSVYEKMKIPLFKSMWDHADIEYVTNVIKRGMYWANGPEIKEIEKKLADFVGTRYCLVFNSGTSALHSVFVTYNIKDKEVIVPSFTFIATANSVLMAGGRPVFADIEDITFGLDPEDVKEKITSKTKAIMPVHYGGCSCKIKEIKEIADDHQLLLIEDAAESLGACINGKMVGSFGDAAMFSFTPSKVISTGEGGVIVTNSRDIYEKMKLIRSHGRLETEDYFSSTYYMDYITLGYNYRMPSINAAHGLAQLEKINKIISKRREIAKIYNKNLSDFENLRTPIAPKHYYHIYQMYSILIGEGRKRRDELQLYLKEKGITSKVYFEPVHKTHFYKNILKYDTVLQNTEEISKQILSIPLYPKLTKDEIEYIVETIKYYFVNYCSKKEVYDGKKI